ncbi:MAG TPA: tryptophan halogenase family protein [Rhizomicrobium sp.]|nr:tryptophan halogenase family protein [Rhizomicrobium sp.]
MLRVRSVLIVGGGTAGWMAAAYLARVLGREIAITLVESPEIGTIGVGEGTFPSIRGTLSTIGIDEADFLRKANATFKQGVHFVDWVRAPGSAGVNSYFHPFSVPSYRGDGLELLPYWLLGAAGKDVAFAEAVTLQKKVADAARAPKRLKDGAYQGALNYAYHFDAVRFAGCLRGEAVALGVRHLQAKVRDVELDERGDVARVVTDDHGALSADLYIDCSGFQALIIGKALGVPFKNLNDQLFVDRAVALQVPYPRPDHPIASYTISTAREAGWIWDIGLRERRGTGYVYSSRYSDDDRAEQVLRDYVGSSGDGLSARRLKLNCGYRTVQWVGNCAAIGLAAGFLEPLEASGIGLIEAAVYLIAHLFPLGGEMAEVSRQFNAQMTGRFERIAAFLKLHYCLSQRTDSQFWIDNADPRTIPDALADKLAMWRTRPPHRLDFIADMEMYPTSSWQFVLYGMEFQTALDAARYPRFDDAVREMRNIRLVAERARGDLPTHRELIERLYAGTVAA